MADDEWYDAVRALTLALVRVRSVSPGTGEVAVAREALRLLREGGLEAAYTASGLDAIPGDLMGRANAYAFLRGASPRTVVLLGHIDTVGTADYGPLEPWALDPEGLATRLDALAAFTPDVAAALAAHPGDWLFGRGVVDMKSGVAANIAVIRRLAERARDQAPPLSVVVLATPDEENESAGVLQAVRLLLRLRDEHGLEYLGAINTDTTLPQFPGDARRYIFGGTVGKLLPSFLVVGREAHVGEPFQGLDANLLAAEVIRDLSMNVDLCDSVGGQRTPPPVTLHAADLKDHYDVQLPFMAGFSLNVLTFTSGPAALLERLRGAAEAALARCLARVDAAERHWLTARGAGGAALVPDGSAESPARSGAVLTYAELRAATVATRGEEAVTAALAAEAAYLPADLDKRDRCLRLVQRLWRESGRGGPALILYYAPPYYPHVAPAPGALHTALAAVAAAHPELDLVMQAYYPYISDMSYLRLDAGMDLGALTRNMPVWQDAEDAEDGRPGDYHLPLAEIARLGLPVANLGPYGAGVHQRGERVLMSYSFGTLPRLILETIERLGEPHA